LYEHLARRLLRPAWSRPSLQEVFPSAGTIANLKSLYRHQADLSGDRSDTWTAPPGATLAHREGEMTPRRGQQQVLAGVSG